MIKLRNLPFYGIAVVFILFAALVFTGCYAWATYGFALLYFVLGIIARNEDEPTHGHH